MITWTIFACALLGLSAAPAAITMADPERDEVASESRDHERTGDDVVLATRVSAAPATPHAQQESLAVKGSSGVDASSGMESDALVDPDALPPIPYDEAVMSQVDALFPTRWMPSRGRDCSRRGRRRICDGPLRVPEPHGAPAELAASLGLGTFETAVKLLHERPAESWVSSTIGEASDTIHWPVAGGRLWRGFGRVRVRSRRLHKGVDIGAPVGTPVLAANDGLVAYSHNGIRGYGNLLMIVHVDGSVTFYAHLAAAYVFAGQQVRRGQPVGEVGETGLARGPHLHFEWHVRGRPRNPIRRFRERPDVALQPRPTG